HHILNVNAVGDKAGDRLVSEHVLADTGNESNGAAGTGGADGLVGPLAACRTGKFTAEDGFPRLGDALDFDDHVGVRTADDEDGVLGHRRNEMAEYWKKCFTVSTR